MKKSGSLLLCLIALVVNAGAQTSASKYSEPQVKLTHANWRATRNPWHLGCDDCAGLPQAAVDYKVNEIDKRRARFEAKQPKYVATAVLKNKGAKTVKSVSVDFLFLEIPTRRELARYLLRSDITILPGHKKKVEQRIYDTEQGIANFSPTQGESLLGMGPVRVRVVLSRLEFADGSTWELPGGDSPPVKH